MMIQVLLIHLYYLRQELLNQKTMTVILMTSQITLKMILLKQMMQMYLLSVGNSSLHRKGGAVYKATEFNDHHNTCSFELINIHLRVSP